MSHSVQNVSADYNNQTITVTDEENDVSESFYFRSLKFVTEPKHNVMIPKIDDSALWSSVPSIGSLIEFIDRFGPSVYLDALEEYSKSKSGTIETLDLEDAEKNTLRILVTIYVRGFGISSKGKEYSESDEKRFIETYLSLASIADSDELNPAFSECYLF